MAVVPRRFRKTLPNPRSRGSGVRFLGDVPVRVFDEGPCQSGVNHSGVRVLAGNVTNAEKPAVFVISSAIAGNVIACEQYLQCTSCSAPAWPIYARAMDACLFGLWSVNSFEPDALAVYVDRIAINHDGRTGNRREDLRRVANVGPCWQPEKKKRASQLTSAPKAEGRSGRSRHGQTFAESCGTT